MSMLAESFEDVVESVSAFNRDLTGSQDLQDKLSYFRAWYYIPELKMVGPSKFIGYKGMTAIKYSQSTGLDGKATEPTLTQWFTALAPGTPETAYVRSLVEQLLAAYGKTVNEKARFLAPITRRLGPGHAAAAPLMIGGGATDNAVRPIVEVFWRAFLGLYPEDQEALASRISAHMFRAE